jgi:hypothetical protein
MYIRFIYLTSLVVVKRPSQERYSLSIVYVNLFFVKNL